jgi:hypothetical protein
MEKLSREDTSMDGQEKTTQSRQGNDLTRQAKHLGDALRELAYGLEQDTKVNIDRYFKENIQKELERQAEISAREQFLDAREEELNRREKALSESGRKTFISALFNWRKSPQHDIARDITKVEPGDFQKVAASQIELNGRYYEEVLMYANRSFLVAVIAASMGIGLFIISWVTLFFVHYENISYIGLISGVVVEGIAGIGFALYYRASRQLESFHVRLDKVMIFLFANTVCEHIKDSGQKDDTRADLVLTMAHYSAQDIKGVELSNKADKEPKNKAVALNE